MDRYRVTNRLITGVRHLPKTHFAREFHYGESLTEKWRNAREIGRIGRLLVMVLVDEQIESD